MQTVFLTRSEEREDKFYTKAHKGNLSISGIIVYPREIKKLIKDGFFVSHIKPAGISDKPELLNVTVDWSHAYPDGIPHMVYSYINHMTDELPKQYIKNYAQELFVIAQRAILKPSK